MSISSKPLPRRIRTLLVLGRVSNLPTVWSNCLAAWLLSGGGPWLQLGLVALGGSLIYTGGMFLNDAFDIDFDRKHRPERPIVAGEVSLRFVWLAGVSLLGLGGLCLLFRGAATAVSGALLVAAVLVYDAIHKKTTLAPLFMATCRFLLYLVAGSAAASALGAPVLWAGGALAAYIVGLSYVARRESVHHPPPRWPTPFLFIPIPIAFVLHKTAEPGLWLATIILVFWIVWCIRGHSRKPKIPLPIGVSGLLAGIALVDWLAACSSGATFALAFIGLFVLALLFQRIAPAT